MDDEGDTSFQKKTFFSNPLKQLDLPDADPPALCCAPVARNIAATAVTGVCAFTFALIVFFHAFYVDDALGDRCRWFKCRS